jgi:hypothetical protein
MNSYPEKTCDIERLIRHPRLVQAVISGQKTQQRRNGVYAYPGEVFNLEGIEFEITSLEQHKISDMTDQDAQAEGFPNLAMYKDLILKMHASMEWNEDALVWVHSFKRRLQE